jgi:hypothetical protein
MRPGTTPYGTSPRFNVTTGLDLTPVAARGDAVLLAMAGGDAPVAPLPQFPSSRTTRTTVYRITATPTGP